MTGFGRAESSTPCGPVRVEIKTLNHKFFDFSPKLPPQIQSFEERIRKTVQARVGRGKIYLSLLCPDAMLKPRKLHVDEGLAREHLSAFRHLRKTLRLRDEIRLSDIVRAPDVLSRPVSVQDVERTWRYVGAATRKALDALEASRRLEGEVIFRDVMQRGRRIRRLLAQIVRRSPRVLAEYKKKLAKRYREDPTRETAQERFQQDLISFAKAADISEERVRLEGHALVLERSLREKDQVGRKIDFIAQEMIREANTMSAKANDFAMSQFVIEIKAELEKIREQAQNVE